MGNPQCRKWVLEINNLQECGFTHDVICEKLMMFFPEYFCLADEIGNKSGLFHTHIFIYSPSPMRFNTLKKRFPIAHIEKAYGSAKENRDYIRKEGKWADTEKADTRIEGSFYEYGVMPKENEERCPKMSKLINCIKDGKTTSEILEEYPEFALRVREIETLNQTLMKEKYKCQYRENIEVIYLFGASGTGKTRSIFQQHSPGEICRITNYHSVQGVRFDNYNAEDVLVFEEFDSRVPIRDMLNYLDIYPLSLPARYNNRTACYTKVYITSNLPLSEQYKDIQQISPRTWEAFLRRIHKVYEFHEDGSITERTEKV